MLQQAQQQQQLVIRTTDSSALSPKSPAPTPSSPAEPPTPTYPPRIPEDKFARALKIYTQYRYEEGLEQRRREHSANGYRKNSSASTPGPPSAYSITTYPSSRAHTTTSLVTSAHEEGVTDLSSLMSFNEDDDAQTCASARTEADAVAFNGNKVKQRVRKRLPPKMRAKAALVRWLGSCSVCRKRRVPCPFQHHDIDALEKAYRAQHNRLQKHPSHSSLSSSSYEPLRSSNTEQVPSAPGTSQAEDLRGLGQNEELLQSLAAFEPHNGSQSPGGSLTDILADLPGLPIIKVEAATPHNMSYIQTDPYADYQDGAKLAIGVHRASRFQCQHLSHWPHLSPCEETFDDAESLQCHFTLAHFSFKRTIPFHYLICSQCYRLNKQITPACSLCGTPGSIEMWIYGEFIRGSPYRRFDAASHELLPKPGRHVRFDTSLDTLNGTSPWAPRLR